jgi:hypothetical protein
MVYTVGIFILYFIFFTITIISPISRVNNRRGEVKLPLGSLNFRGMFACTGFCYGAEFGGCWGGLETFCDLDGGGYRNTPLSVFCRARNNEAGMKAWYFYQVCQFLGVSDETAEQMKVKEKKERKIGKKCLFRNMCKFRNVHS